MTIYPLFTVHTLRPIYVFPNVLDFIEEELCIYKSVRTLSGVRAVFWILRPLHILCTSAVKRYYAKIDNFPFKCHLFPMHWNSWKQEKRATEIRPQSGQFLTLESFATNIVSSRLPRRRSSEARPVTLLDIIIIIVYWHNIAVNKYNICRQNSAKICPEGQKS